MKDFKLTFLNQNLFLHPYRALFWEDQHTLLIADIHLGKAGHFRKNGIPIPGEVHKTDLERLSHLCDFYEPKKIIVLGDFFHSEINGEWHQFLNWKDQHTGLNIDLIKGNHDILTPEEYAVFNLHTELLIQSPFLFTHLPLETTNESSYYNICGHIHPSVRVGGAAKQSWTAPCFSFGKTTALLPAFGKFTGGAKISPKRGDLIFIIADGKVIRI